MLPLSPAARDAVDALRRRQANMEGRRALQHLRAAQAHRRRARAAAKAAQTAGAPQPTSPADRWPAITQHIRTHPGVTTAQLAAATGTTPTTMSGRLDTLRRHGVIDRTITRGPHGGRQAHWTLTEAEAGE